MVLYYYKKEYYKINSIPLIEIKYKKNYNLKNKRLKIGGIRWITMLNQFNN